MSRNSILLEYFDVYDIFGCLFVFEFLSPIFLYSFHFSNTWFTGQFNFSKYKIFAGELYFISYIRTFQFCCCSVIVCFCRCFNSFFALIFLDFRNFLFFLQFCSVFLYFFFICLNFTKKDFYIFILSKRSLGQKLSAPNCGVFPQYFFN